MRFRLCLLALLSPMFLAACTEQPEDGADARPPAEAGSPGAESRADGSDGISVDRLTSHVRTLASDEFQGRAPSTPGEDKTVRYIAEHFEKAGLEPGNGGEWYQRVPLVSIDLAPDTVVRFENAEGISEYRHGDDVVVWTKRVTDEVTLDRSEMVFVGYGIVAPEYGWNDYDGVDVEGKTVVMLVNDPGYATRDPSLFDGKAMTYYGRWTYKYAEAARQGAAGAIVIHETGPAGYPWEVVSGSWTGPQFDLVRDNGNSHRTKLEGWIKHGVADRLFGGAGMSYEDAKRKALEGDFRAIPLGLRVSATLKNEIRRTESRNVIGVLEGEERPGESVIYMAHWDHLGVKPDMADDNIFNGARDNATGVAGLIEIARAFSSGAERPERSVVFLAVTAEESGLLGSKYYSENPVYPLEKTAAAINMDRLNVYGKTRDVIVIGKGSSELEDYLADAAGAQDRVVKPEPTPEKGYYYRSDHFNLAKKGVPALYARAGNDLLEGGSERGERLEQAYNENHYHKPSDEYDPAWDLDGLAQQLRLLHRVGEAVANSRDWPEWREGNEFRAVRAESKEKR